MQVCEMQTCIWPSWCHCHSLSLASVKSRLVLPLWYRPTRVVPEKGPLNRCVCQMGVGISPKKRNAVEREDAWQPTVQYRNYVWWWCGFHQITLDTCYSVLYTHVEYHYCCLKNPVPSELTLPVARQEEHPTCKNWVMGCWCAYLSGARCRFCLHMVQLMPLPSPNPIISRLT